MVEWLEAYLAAQKRAMLLVTHDRYFLDAVCQEIIEIDQGELQRYRGNYSYYLQSKVERTDARNKTIEKARGLYKTELEWSKRMPQARATKSKYRMEAVQELRELATKRTDEDELVLDVQTERLGSKILELHNVGKGFGGRTLFQKFDYKFKRPDRIGIVGRNGSGKSTLLDLFTGAQEPDTGKVVRGETLHIGYYRQEGLKFRDGQRVVDVVRDVAEFLPMSGGRKLTATQLLERFLFDKHTHYQHVSTLSGGERRRLYLLTILMKNPNLLILDEPTNDLDILTLSVLEDFLLRFTGCLIIVSHDRYFMDKLVDHLFVFEGNGTLRDFHGNYSAYRAELDALEDQRRLESANKSGKGSSGQSGNQGRSGEGLSSPGATASGTATVSGTGTASAAAAASGASGTASVPLPASASGTAAKPAGSPKPKIGFKEKREFEALEALLPELEARKAELESRLASGTLPHTELVALSAELAQVLADLESKTDRWLEMSEWM
jgi:ATP-binding cassette subfamily F protein uup